MGPKNPSIFPNEMHLAGGVASKMAQSSSGATAGEGDQLGFRACFLPKVLFFFGIMSHIFGHV